MAERQGALGYWGNRALRELEERFRRRPTGFQEGPLRELPQAPPAPGAAPADGGGIGGIGFSETLKDLAQLAYLGQLLGGDRQPPLLVSQLPRLPVAPYSPAAGRVGVLRSQGGGADPLQALARLLRR